MRVDLVDNDYEEFKASVVEFVRMKWNKSICFEDGSDYTKKITYENIESAVCSHYDIHKEELVTRCRKPEYTTPRHMIMYIADKNGYTLEYIAEQLSLKNHTTVMHGRDKIADLMKRKKMVRKEYDDIMTLIKRQNRRQ